MKYKYIKDGIIYNEVKYVVLDNMAVINPSHEQILSAGYEVYIEPTPPAPTPEQLLEEAKQEKITSLEAYDKSSAVNEFFMGETSMWLDKETRAGLKLRFESETAVGREETTLWYNNVCYTLALTAATEMLVQLEVYASDCYDTTAQHKQNITNLTTVEDVEAYDYTTGYPEKLHFVYNSIETVEN